MVLYEKIFDHVFVVIYKVEAGRDKPLLCPSFYAYGTYESKCAYNNDMSIIKCTEKNILLFNSLWLVSERKKDHIKYFFLYLGMAPYTFITVQTGSFLSQLNSFDDLFTWRTLLTLGLIATVVGCTGLAVARVRRKIPQTVI